MELKDIQSDLHALQKLYGLLKDDGGALPNAMSDMLDDKARHMLKNLLDVATEKVFKAHSEIVGSYMGESFSSQPQLHEDSVNQKFPVQANLSKQDPAKGFGEDLKDLKFSLLNEERRCSNPASQSAIVSFAASGLANRKRRCRICQRSTVKQPKSTSLFSDKETQDLKRVNPLQHRTNNHDNPFYWSDGLDKGSQSNNRLTEPVRDMEKKRQVGDDNTSYNLSCAGSTALSVNRPTSPEVKSESVPKCSAETTKNIKEADYLSKEASEAIKEIESRILALQVDTENSGPPRKRAAQHDLPCMSTSFVPVTDTDHTVMQTKGGEARDSDPSNTGECDTVGKSFLHQAVNQSDQEMKNKNSPSKIPTRSMTRAMEIKLPNLMVNQIPKPFAQTHSMMSQIESHNIRSNAGFTSGFNTLSARRKPVVKQSLQNQKLNQVPSQNVKATPKKFESLYKKTVPNDQMLMSKVKRFGFPEDTKKMSNWATASFANFPSQINKENQDENEMDWNERIRKCIVVDSAHKVYPTRMARGKKHFPGKLPKRPGVLDHKRIQPSFSSASYDTWLDHRQVGVMNDNKRIRPVRKVLIDREESESINSDSDSPSWTNLQISTSCTDTEEYSISRGMQSDASPSSSYESEGCSLPQRNQDHYAGSTSSSENEVYSSASGSGTEIYSSTSSARTRQLTPTSRSESDRYSSRVQPGMHHVKGQMYSSDSSASRRKGPAGVHRSTNRDTKKKQNGRFKKLKDKLAIIFHHHHHHHHHLHPGDESDHTNQQAKISRGKALWKQSKKLTCPKREKETYGEHAVEKLGKSMVRDRPSRNQHRHFHELVKGVLRHIRRSKESKASKKAKKRLERTQHGNKKAFKKSHWWQLLRHQKGVQMLKKGHTKVGFDNKKNQFKTFPKMK